MPTVFSFALLQQQTAEQIVDIAVLRGRGGSGGGGLQGFHPGQGSQRTVEQHVDIPVPGDGLHGSLPDPGFAAPPAVSRDELVQGSFITLFPDFKKVRSPPGVRVRGCTGTRAHPS